MGEKIKPQERCENCGFAMPENNPKGAWKYFCANDGKSRRGGDTCAGYCEAGELKKIIDEAARLVKE